MIRTSVQLKAKVGNLSGGDNNKAKMLIRNFIMERFLERIALSQYRNNFILKGGMLVAAVRNESIMKEMWDKYRRDNFFVGDISWENVNESVLELRNVLQV